MADGFFRRWWKGTKQVAVSPLGGLQTSIILNFFVLFGCLVGAFQVKIAGGFGFFSIILFAVGLLTLYNWVLTIRQYRSVKNMSRVFEETKKFEKINKEDGDM